MVIGALKTCFSGESNTNYDEKYNKQISKMEIPLDNTRCNYSNEEERVKAKYLNETHKKTSEAAETYIAKSKNFKADWIKELEQMKKNSKD